MGAKPSIPMGLIMSNELKIIGSHGMAAHKYSDIFALIKKGKLQPEKLIGKTISLEESLNELMKMDQFIGTGVTVINRF